MLRGYGKRMQQHNTIFRFNIDATSCNIFASNISSNVAFVWPALKIWKWPRKFVGIKGVNMQMNRSRYVLNKIFRRHKTYIF